MRISFRPRDKSVRSLFVTLKPRVKPEADNAESQTFELYDRRTLHPSPLLAFLLFQLVGGTRRVDSYDASDLQQKYNLMSAMKSPLSL